MSNKNLHNKVATKEILISKYNKKLDFMWMIVYAKLYMS